MLRMREPGAPPPHPLPARPAPRARLLPRTDAVHILPSSLPCFLRRARPLRPLLRASTCTSKYSHGARGRGRGQGLVVCEDRRASANSVKSGMRGVGAAPAGRVTSCGSWNAWDGRMRLVAGGWWPASRLQCRACHACALDMPPPAAKLNWMEGVEQHDDPIQEYHRASLRSQVRGSKFAPPRLALPGRARSRARQPAMGARKEVRASHEKPPNPEGEPGDGRDFDDRATTRVAAESAV
ncbi:hypothetical protein C8Q78DRAFT_315845 [Trametes maxima]|nr:hypothetical protein C8Q78DRAFT_315845 [Trametes maxima]